MAVSWKAPRYRQFYDYWGGDLSGFWRLDAGQLEEAEAFDFLTASQRTHLEAIRAGGRRRFVERVNDWPGELAVVGERAYPKRLMAMKKPPAALHIVGNAGLLREAGIAVVGSREITVEAAVTARQLLRPLEARGVTIISGGALGADGVAHRCSVEGRCKTVVVLPSGVDRPSPRSHSGLFRDILRGGGTLISEYPPGTSVRPYHFRRRNGVIAALSYGVWVIRAGEASGTMLTVEAARGLERPLAAMPGSPGERDSEGCLAMIRDGATLISSGQQLWEWWRDVAPEQWQEMEVSRADDQASASEGCPFLSAARRIDAGGRGFSLEALVREVDAPAATVQGALLKHELAGLIERQGGGDRYCFC